MKNAVILISLALSLGSCDPGNANNDITKIKNANHMENPDTAVLGAGCFWCVEAVFEELKGVYEVEAGYAGGHVKNPSYREVCTGTTGHAEVAKITYNPEEISFRKLLSVFFKTHDPTTLNAQGPDKGPQYRSAIFYNSEEQQQTAQQVIDELTQANVYPDPIVTEVTALTNYYPAENYHQDYYAENPNKSYCTVIIQPKLEKFREVFKEDLKEGVKKE